jgi:hypothetical protein
VHISGRSANAQDRECAVELSPLTRHTIGGAAEDPDVPPAPHFGLEASGRGTLEVVGIGFDDLQCTRSITAGTLGLHYRDELQSQSDTRLAQDIDAAAETITFAAAAPVTEGMLMQIESEVVVVQTVDEGGLSCTVKRGAYESAASTHSADTVVFPLERRLSVMPFVKGFFGTPASGSYGHRVDLPNVRIVVAELFVTNARGNSQVTGISYAHLEGGGIRTLSGGQIALQVDGPLAIQSNAVPPLATDTPRAVRDVFGTLSTPPSGGDVQVRVNVSGEPYCDLTFASGETVSGTVDGSGLPPLRPNGPVGLDIVSIPQGANTSSGAGLTVTIRF